MALSARVALYANLVDPFTSEQALWEFENLFVRAGKSKNEWKDIAEKLESDKNAEPSEGKAQAMIHFAKEFLAESARIYQSLKA